MISCAGRGGAKEACYGYDYRATDPQAAPLCGRPSIVDADQTTFVKEVIEASRSVPVLVDFWATWCGPLQDIDADRWRKVVKPRQLRRGEAGKSRRRQKPRSWSSNWLGWGCRCSPSRRWPRSGRGRSPTCSKGALPESEVKRFVEQLPEAGRRGHAGGGAAGGGAGGARGRAGAGRWRAVQRRARAPSRRTRRPGEGWCAPCLRNGSAWSRLMRRWSRCLPKSRSMPRSLAPVVRSRLAEEGQRGRRQGWPACNAGSAADPADHEARYELATAH